MDLNSKSNVNPVVVQQHLSNPRTQVQHNLKKILKNKYNSVGLSNKKYSSASDVTHVVRDQLATGSEPVPQDMQKPRQENEVIYSNGINNPPHFEESDELMVSEGAT